MKANRDGQPPLRRSHQRQGNERTIGMIQMTCRARSVGAQRKSVFLNASKDASNQSLGRTVMRSVGGRGRVRSKKQERLACRMYEVRRQLRSLLPHP